MCLSLFFNILSSRLTYCQYTSNRFPSWKMLLQNLPIGVNVVSEGSPSLILRVLLISFGITIRPRSSTRLTIPVAVPDIFVGFQKPSSSVDRGHSLRSLHPPPAALPSLPSCFHFVYLLFAFVGGGALDAPQRHFHHRTTGCRGRQPLQ